MINEHNNLLHLAARQGEHELVKLLLLKGIYLFIFKPKTNILELKNQL